VKRIKIFVLKGFDIVYVKSMVGKWCDINYTYTIEMWENIYANKNIDFYNYVINIHSFGHKPTYEL